MTSGRWTARTDVALMVGVATLAVLVGVDLATGVALGGTYAGATVLASATGPTRSAAAVAVLGTALAAVSGTWHDGFGTDWAVRLAACAAISTGAVAALVISDRRRRQVQQTSGLAQAMLDALASELTGARTVKDVAEGFVGKAAVAVGATSALVYVLDADDVLRSIAWMGRGGAQADQYHELPLTADVPGAVAARDGKVRHYRSLAEIEADFPALRGYYGEERSLHLLPLHHEGTILGLLALTFPRGVVPTAGHESLLVSMSGALTQAVVRARELEESDSATQRTALLAEASLTLGRSLDLQTTLAETCRLLVPRFADWCSVQLLRDGQLETAAVQHRDPETTAWALSMQGAFPTDMDAPTGAANVIRTGLSEHFPFIPQELVEAGAQSEEHLQILRRLGLTSAIVAPLTGRQGVFGVVTLIHAESGRRYGAQDLGFLEAVADRVAMALDTAASFARQGERLAGVTLVAEAAQRAILAPPPERVGPVALSARYVSAAVEAQVGGDLYEVVAAPGSVRLLVGDVRGKGLAAVRTATVVLGEFRAAAAGTSDLAHVAREIDERMRAHLLTDEDFVTGVLVEITDDGRFTVVSCGHPAPVVLRASGAVDMVELDHAPPLGLGVDPVPASGRLEPGDRALLFTDGLVEARTRDGAFVDPAPLFRTAGTAPFDLALSQVLEELLQTTGHSLDDDLALLLARYEPDAD
ncbi:hypothetical protein NSZ01_26250 [Nocardioides szechwanensis]|uniref:Serine phosphatase RsbU, regulator of sigma subunit n=1 Tax=Nocardioides szechwanensis TaxID=1005944 RepID=A0A1H0AIK3_9ACTN|nr:SpoIIE family protein phosphatase [Nocardioides szechwanensis]GEP34857.1 hypothetical protein NSZ01_26250 [Nocardioides szechwanensis]SDN32893.1 Serine phosphatase RsbU, regulator of sigma subunit [Nocardioides szechwanensis]